MEQQKQPVEAGNSGKMVITTPYNPDITILPTINAYLKVLGVPKELLKQYFKMNPKERGFNVLNVLLFIMANPYSSSTHLFHGIQLDNRTVKGCIRLLMSSGYIILQYRRMFIVPFNAYRSIPTYVITVKGKTVLNKLLNY